MIEQIAIEPCAIAVLLREKFDYGNGIVTHLGTFDSPDLASAAYISAKRELHDRGRHD